MNIGKINSEHQRRIEQNKIRLNFYDRQKKFKSVSPESDIIDLNDYYNQGFKTDEQNSEERKVIREDILERYNIDENDENNDEKLSVIYSEIALIMI